MVHSLDRLTETERDLLRLLAEGHTVKSIANARGLSVHVVNERLRAARRRTGAASSRELARTLVARTGGTSQINRNTIPGVEEPGPGHHQSGGRAFSNTARGHLLWKGSTVISTLAAALALAIVTSTPMPTTNMDSEARRWAIVDGNRAEGWVVVVDWLSIERRGPQATFTQADITRGSDGTWGARTSVRVVTCDEATIGRAPVPYGTDPQQKIARLACDGDEQDVAGPFSREITLDHLVQIYSPR
ncbi:MAG: LuxR C-terminal-related transcriptional regulator [Caulobacteraceae bacterium]|nr:LuxR C-terminal-related transcriptional regulator [Caulobacteraceae bacterium]